MDSRERIMGRRMAGQAMIHGDAVCNFEHRTKHMSELGDDQSLTYAHRTITE